MNASLSDPAFWSRLQFAFTLTYHYLFPQLTMGLAWFLVYWKWRALRTGDEKYHRAARFWARIFGSRGSGSLSKTSSAAPFIRPPCSAAIKAASDTIGPREEFTRYAVGFIRLSSRSLTRLRVRSLSLKWILTISAWRNRSSFSTRSTPC